MRKAVDRSTSEDERVDLILWRHAEAEDGFVDTERKLTAKGEKQAARVAKWLRARIPPDAIVLVSPAKRAQQTAHALTDDFKTVTEIGLAASAQSVLGAAGWQERDGTIVVVGHQPTLGEAAALALTGETASWSLKKGALIWLAVRDEAHAQLRAAISPDLI
jgi:phosphohistidine phosphatase